MSNLEKYNEIIEQSKQIINKIEIFEESTIIKDYLELKKEEATLFEIKHSLYKSMKKDQYASCSHILVYSDIEHDRLEGRTSKSCGCIKCGLDNSILSYNKKYLPFLPCDKRIMYNYLEKNSLTSEIDTKIACDLDLAQAIYSKIIEHNPDIDDETATKYFEIALDNIRNIKVSDERKASRAKRLSLSPNFNKWYGRDVHHD